MTTIKCNNSEHKAVEFFLNGGRKDEIMVFAVQDGELEKFSRAANTLIVIQ